MLVVHFVRPAHAFEISVVDIPENFKALVDKYIMNEKVGKPIYRNAKPDPEQKVVVVGLSDPQKGNSGDCEDEKEEIIVFKKSGRFFLMMVFV